MKHALLFFAVVAIATTGCNAGPWDAPPGSVISDVEDVKVAWFGCVLNPETGEAQSPNCDINQPSPPVIFPYRVAITNEDTELPVNNVWVRASSGFADIYILPQEVIEALALPDTENWNEIAESGEVWAQFSGDFEGDYRPTFLETWTDNNGQIDFWVWVQKLPVDPQSGQAKESGIMLDIGVDSAVVALTAGS